MTSAERRAVERAEEALRGEESGTTPLPIGVGRKGILVLVMSVLEVFGARVGGAFAEMMSGEWAERRRMAARATRVGSEVGLGGGETRARKGWCWEVGEEGFRICW